jgi:hypothetical protein
MVCAWAWRLVETRAYIPMRSRHLRWHRPHRLVAVGPRHRPAHQQLVGLVPTAVAVAVGLIWRRTVQVGAIPRSCNDDSLTSRWSHPHRPTRPVQPQPPPSRAAEFASCDWTIEVVHHGGQHHQAGRAAWRQAAAGRGRGIGFRRGVRGGGHVVRGFHWGQCRRAVADDLDDHQRAARRCCAAPAASASGWPSTPFTRPTEAQGPAHHVHERRGRPALSRLDSTSNSGRSSWLMSWERSDTNGLMAMAALASRPPPR